ncbi:hypothetical protein EJD97_004625, partial [Solanum chilense]
MFNNEFHPAHMNNIEDEIGIGEGEGEAQAEGPNLESKFPPTPIVGKNNSCDSQTSRVNNVKDDEIRFYKGMTFKNKQELANSLKIACLKKEFKLKQVMNSRNLFSFKYSYPECNWWL